MAKFILDLKYEVNAEDEKAAMETVVKYQTDHQFQMVQGWKADRPEAFGEPDVKLVEVEINESWE